MAELKTKVNNAKLEKFLISKAHVKDSILERQSWKI